MSYQPYDPNQGYQGGAGAPPAQQYPPQGQQGQYAPPQAQPVQPAQPAQPYQPPAGGYQPTQDQYNQPLVDKPRFDYTENQYRDKGWAFLFLAHIGVLVVCAVMWGSDLLTYIKDQEAGGGDNSPTFGATEEPTNDIKLDEKQLIVSMLVAAVGAGVFAAGWLHIMKQCADTIIKISLGISCLALAISALLALYAGQGIVAVFMLLMLGMTCLYFYFVRKRIPFTQAVIHASTSAIQANPGPVFVVYVMAVGQVLWLGFWAFTVMSIYHHIEKNQTDTDTDKTSNFGGINGIVYFLLLVSLYWTAQVLKNIGHVTTAGTVASWWMLPDLRSPTGASLKRALTTSFGSICFGSLIVAVLKAMRAMIDQAKRSAARSNNGGAACALACLECILGCLERMMEYFNMYAYTMVAIYGKDFMSAAKDTWALFKARGFDALINDDLTGMVLTMGCLLGGCVAGILGGGLAYTADSSNGGWVICGVLAFVVGVVMTSLVMNVVESAVATTYVCWAEDPQAISSTRPEAYNKIADAARIMHPSLGV